MDLTNCLFQWLKTFDLKEKCEKPEDLCDGVAIANALVQIAPEYFSSAFLSKIEKECSNNWFLKVSNLRRIYLTIVDYYGEVLDRMVPDKLQPNLESIARDYELDSLGKLLQLILGCAINCVNKEKHIEIMTTLSLQVKQALKIAIDELENFQDGTSNVNDSTMNATNSFQQLSSNINFPNDRAHTIEEFQKIQEELSMVNILKENALQKCSELESVINKLEEDKRNLKFENDKLIEKLSRNSSLSDKNHRFDSIDNENLFQRLNGQVNTLQLELTRMEEQKEDYKINLEIKEKEYQKLLLQVEHLQTKLNEFKYDRDELDRLGYLNEEIIKYKNINEMQKKKLEEFQEYKKQMKVVEDRNAALIKQICELEEDKKTIAVYKSKLELIKQKRDELMAKVNEETFRADKTEDELKRIHKKYNDLVAEKEKIHLELESVKSEMVSHKGDSVLNAPSIVMDLSVNTQQMLGADINLYHSNKNSDIKQESDLKEKLIRLEYENNKLKNELKHSNDEKVKLLESQLDDEKNRVTKLESESRINNQRIIELEGQIKDLKPSATIDLFNTDESIKSKLIKDLQAENNNLKSLLEKKNEELAEREENYRKHLNKAKETYGILETHAKMSSATSLPSDPAKLQSDDVCYWKNLCNQKDIEMEKLRNEFEQANAIRDIEEQMMSVSFHTMTYNLQRKAAEDRLYSSQFPGNPTFLSRQRQASSRKFVIPSKCD